MPAKSLNLRLILHAAETFIPIRPIPPLLPFQTEKAEPIRLAVEMRNRRGPRPGIGGGDHSRTNWIEIHVTQTIQDMSALEYAAEIAILPKMPATAVTLVESLGVLPVSSTDEPRKPLDFLWTRDEMDMITHQTKSNDPNLLASGIPDEMMQIHLIIKVSKKNILTIVASLCDVVKMARGDQS
jgi:hypothetical protein